MVFAAISLASSCADDDTFSTSSSHILTFSTDTVMMDTVFSNVPSAAKSFWVYNKSGDGLRAIRVRLENGSRSGYRVNVDGEYLGAATDYSISDIEVRNKDSIRVFVELTSPSNHAVSPQQSLDNLVFTLESGVEQKVQLNAWSWDATLLRNVHITKDSTLNSSTRPVVIYGGIQIDSAATLTLAAGTTLYFHGDAGLDVRGCLKSEGTASQPVTLKGDRLDRMFDYLPYDFVPGQWKGIHFYPSSYNNSLAYTDIHGTYDGILIDSSAVDKPKLSLANSTIHNCQGYGLRAINSQLTIENTQISNTLNDCMRIDGGSVMMTQCTLAQFYPFDSNRGAAFRFTSQHPLVNLSIQNSLITGYADDVLMAYLQDTTRVANYAFSDCIIRTPRIVTKDSLHFTRVVYEDIKDTTTCGVKHFKRIDTKLLRYDFHLDSVSSAIDKANPATTLPIDHDGDERDTRPDIGAYEYRPNKT